MGNKAASGGIVIKNQDFYSAVCTRNGEVYREVHMHLRQRKEWRMKKKRKCYIVYCERHGHGRTDKAWPSPVGEKFKNMRCRGVSENTVIITRHLV